MGVIHHIADTNTVGVFQVAAVGSDSVKRTFIENENQAGKKTRWEGIEHRKKEEDIHASISPYFHQVGVSRIKGESRVVIIIIYRNYARHFYSKHFYILQMDSTCFFYFFINLLYSYINISYYLKHLSKQKGQEILQM